MKRLQGWTTGLALAAVVAAPLVPSAALAAPRSAAPAVPRVAAPTGVRAKAGTSGVIAVLGWHAVPGAASYRVWRSTRSLAGFEPVGSTTATSFSDTSGVPNRTYYYQVTAMLSGGSESRGSTTTAGVRPGWNQSPHATYGKGDLCLVCHAQHAGDGSPVGGEVTVCYSCHDGQGAQTNVKDGPTDSFALASGHRVEEATTTPDLTNECSSCHSPHADPRQRPGLYAKRIRSLAVSGGNAWCGRCHDDVSSWRPGYPAAGVVVRDASGYPILGTYPGPTVYARTAGTGHAGITGTAGGPKGDCLLCHAAHRGPNRYDGLLMQFRPTSASSLASDQAQGTNAELCLNCHSGRAQWAKQGAIDIRRYVTRRDSAGYAAHSIVTSGGTLPVGAPVPCYDCHDPHGSARGNASLLSDVLGRDLATADGTGVREFCLACHATSDGLVWDSADSAYAKPGSAEVEGLRRDGSDGSVLRLPGGVEGHERDSGRSCYSCHGDDYSSAAGFNVHAPRRVGVEAPEAPVVPSAGQEKTSTVTPSAE